MTVFLLYLRTYAKYALKILKVILKVIIEIGVYISFPLVFLSGERKFLPFHDYKVVVKNNFWLAIYHGVLYIFWGSLTFFYFLFTYFTYKSLRVYSVNIFGYPLTGRLHLILILISIFIGVIYFFLVFSLTRKIDKNRNFGLISVFSNLLRILILVIWVSLLVMPLYIEQQLLLGMKLEQINIFDTQLLEENLSLNQVFGYDSDYGIQERWKVLELFYEGIYMEKEYIHLIKKYTKIFVLAFVFKGILLFVDLRYIKHKIKEASYVI